MGVSVPASNLIFQLFFSKLFSDSASLCRQVEALESTISTNKLVNIFLTYLIIQIPEIYCDCLTKWDASDAEVKPSFVVIRLKVWCGIL